MKQNHGQSRTKVYAVWNGMKARCHNPKNKNKQYKHYGARGITLCSEWHDFLTFKAWVDEQSPEDRLELDRRDNDKGYSPGNCRFVTPAINSLNRRSRSDNTTGFRGVFRSGAKGMFRMEVRTKSGPHKIQRGFPSAEAAALARDQHCIKHSIPAKLNFPEGPK